MRLTTALAANNTKNKNSNSSSATETSAEKPTASGSSKPPNPTAAKGNSADARDLPRSPPPRSHSDLFPLAKPANVSLSDSSEAEAAAPPTPKSRAGIRSDHAGEEGDFYVDEHHDNDSDDSDDNESESESESESDEDQDILLRRRRAKAGSTTGAGKIPALYRHSSLGLSLVESLEEMIEQETLSHEAAIQIMEIFDQVATRQLLRHHTPELNGHPLRISGTLSSQRFVDEVWTWLVRDATIAALTKRKFQVPLIKIVACKAPEPAAAD
jgi:transcription initiation factor TFIIA small subunit